MAAKELDDAIVRVPNPDPTALTTKALEAAIANLSQSTDLQITNLKDVLLRVRDQLDQRPAALIEGVTHLRDLLISEIKKLEAVFEEKFTRIDGQFVERDKRAEQLAIAASTAIAAALQAQKEAVGEQNKSGAAAIAKSESSFLESIRQLNALFANSNQSLDEKITALNKRMDLSEGRNSGYAGLWAFIVGGIGLISVIIGIFVTIYSLANKSTAVVEPTIVIQKPDGSFTPVR